MYDSHSQYLNNISCHITQLFYVTITLLVLPFFFFFQRMTHTHSKDHDQIFYKLDILKPNKKTCSDKNQKRLQLRDRLHVRLVTKISSLDTWASHTLTKMINIR